MGKRLCFLCFRPTSAACGIGCLGDRAERRFKRVFLDSDYLAVFGLPRPAWSAAIPAGFGGVLPGADVEADAGDAAVCAAVARLLAVSEAWNCAGRKSALF